MTNFLQEVKDKIDKKLNAEEVLLVDNSSLHSKHKSFDSKKFHLKLIIKSKQLQNLRKIEAHKIIFSILKEEMKDKIHALEIEIK
tara:strand:+ start:480 stop:734 length:255 start_codon:yes stop_codon:yes gene_type:complete